MNSPLHKLLSIPAALAAGGALILCLIACTGRGSEAAEKTEKRGEITIEYYAPKSGIGHGDGTPGGCTIIFKGERYNALPMVKDGGKIFRCDVKENSDEEVVRIAFYKPEDDWTCDTRFGRQQAKCLPDRYKPVGGILTVKNGVLVLEEHGFWDTSYDWGTDSVKFTDGREYNYKTGAWTGCGDKPTGFIKTGTLLVAKGRSCRSGEWNRVYINGKEIRPEGSGAYPFDSITVNLDPTVPSAIFWMGSVNGFIYASNGSPTIREVAESPEFFDNGKTAKWWSEDYQVRHRMDLATGRETTESRDEVFAALKKKTDEKDRLKQKGPLLAAEDLGKIEIDYQDKHGQLYLGDLRRHDPLAGIGVAPHVIKPLLTSASGSSTFYLFMMRSAIETPSAEDKCLGGIATTIVWFRADEGMIAREAKSQVVSSCSLGPTMIGEPKINNETLSVEFTDAAGKHLLTYDNRAASAGFTVN